MKFDATNNILTLTNATITGTGLQFFAYNGKAPSIQLIGTNTVTCNKYDATSSGAYAIYIDLVNNSEGGNATFGGSGTLIASVTDAAIDKENTRTVAAIYGRTQYSSGSKEYFGYMYIGDGTTVEATVPNVSREGMKAAGVMLGNGFSNDEGAEGSEIRFTGMTGRLTAKGSTRAIYSYKVMNNYNKFVTATVSENYDGSNSTTIPEENYTYDISLYKYFTYNHVCS